MEVRDWVTLASAVIIVVGWFVNSWLNRRHEIAKKKLEHRLNALQSYMPFTLSIVAKNPMDDPQLEDKLRTAHLNISLYGTAEEIKLMDELYDAMGKLDNERIRKAHPALYECVRKKLREELGIDS